MNKSFPHYDELSYVFGKDRVTGAHAETFADIESNVPRPSDSVYVEDGLGTEFPAMCSPRMNLSPDDMMVRRFGRSNDCRSDSSG